MGTIPQAITLNPHTNLLNVYIYIYFNIYLFIYIIYIVRSTSTKEVSHSASKPYIARSDCAYVIEQWRSMAHALTEFPPFPQ
jgi:uncharacterized membrane protein